MFYRDVSFSVATYRGVMILMNVVTIDQMLQNYRIYVWDQITEIWFNRNLNLHVWSASTLRAWLPPVKEQKIHKSNKYWTSYKLKENIKIKVQTTSHKNFLQSIVLWIVLLKELSWLGNTSHRALRNAKLPDKSVIKHKLSILSQKSSSASSST